METVPIGTTKHNRRAYILDFLLIKDLPMDIHTTLK